jgi:hypothetical protein
MTGEGRFFPISIAEGSIVFDTLQTRFSYKIFLVTMVLIDVALAYMFVAKLTRQRWTACLVAVLVAAEFDFRFFYDGIQEFTGQQGLMLALIFISAIATLKYLDSAHRWWLFVIAVSWAAALTTYETSYLMIPVLWIAIWHRRPKRNQLFASLAASGIPTALIGGYVLYLRLSLTAASSASYTVKLSPSVVFDTLGKQLTGTLPFSEYYLGGSKDIVGFWNAPDFSIFSVVLAVVVAIVIAVALYRQSLTRRDHISLFCVGALMLIGPAILVALTETWQETLTWGIAYISVYVQGFGLVMMAVVLASVVVGWVRSLSNRGLAQSLRGGLILVVAVASSFAILGVAGNNDRVINTRDVSLGWIDQQPSLGWSRQVVTDAEQDGLFSKVGKSNRIAALTGGPSINSDEVSYESGVQVNIVNQFPYWTLDPQAVTQLPGCPLAAGTCKPSSKYQSILYVSANGYNAGYAVLGSYSSATSLSSFPDDVVADLRNPTVFVEDPSITSSSKVTLCRLGEGKSVRRIRAIRTIRAGNDWRLLEGRTNLRVAVQSIGLDLDDHCVGM